MGSIKALSLATAVALGTAGTAAAADLLPPPPLMPAPIPVSLDTSGWYLRADVGVAVDNSYAFRSTLQPNNAAGGPAPAISRVFNSIGDSAIFGVGVGYQINNWFRADVTGEYRTSASYKTGLAYVQGCATSFCLDTYNANHWKGHRSRQWLCRSGHMVESHTVRRRRRGYRIQRPKWFDRCRSW